MLVIPAIDLRGGLCVRLHQGRYEEETIYFDDPVKMARLWRVLNARALHLVDLDAARETGTRANREIIRQICQELDIPVEVGGGIRTMEEIEELVDAGVYRVVLGTAAVQTPDLVSEAIAKYTCSRVVVGVDAQDGEVQIEGRRQGTGVGAVDLAADMHRRGVRRIIYTDIARDGTLQGLNHDAIRTLAENVEGIRITASGGVSGYRDLLRLKELEPLGVDSIIVGRALYENRFPCQQFWCWHQKDRVDLSAFSTARLVESGETEPCN
jgi:phosphoribosylformimino-5-aminoimidazole carboxamide ribotide isomerase